MTSTQTLPSDFSDNIVKCSLAYYDSLPKRGKPHKGTEWTLLSTVVMTTTKGRKSKMKVVALGTGSKCIHPSKMSRLGDIIADSHAEIIARRSLLCFFYEELKNVYSGRPSDVFDSPVAEDGYRVCLKEGVAFTLYSSQTPCGDAGIFPKTDIESDCSNTIDQVGDTSMYYEDDICSVSKKRKRRDSNNCTVSKISKTMNYDDLNSDKVSNRISPSSQDKWTSSKNLNPTKFELAIEKRVLETESDIHRTGAKCVSGDKQDPLGSGEQYHVVGPLRTKPGRGERTLSMSCSDKIARWNILGVQGALCGLFLTRPIYLFAIVVGRCPYCERAMRRAVIGRLEGICGLPKGYRINSPYLLQSSMEFTDSRESAEVHGGGSKVVPSSAAISSYVNASSGSMHTEVSVNGKKQGFTAKNINTPQARSGICSYEIFKKFKSLAISSDITSGLLCSQLTNHEEGSYLHWKSLATDYQLAWKQLREQRFSSWIQKDRDFYTFTT